MNRPGERRLSVWFSAITVAIAVAVLAGWGLRVSALVSLSPGFVVMMPATAMMFLFMGFAVLSAWLRWMTLAVALAVLTMTTVAMCLIVAMFVSTGLSGPLFNEQYVAPGTATPGVPSLGTLLAFSLASFGVVIGALGNGVLRPMRKAVGWLVALGGVSALMGYITGVNVLYWYIPGVSMPMAVHTGIAFVLLGAAVHEMEASVALPRR